MRFKSRHILERDRKLHRCLAIAKRLMDGERHMVSDLSNEFGVGVRSIHRDFAALNEAGFAARKVTDKTSWEIMK